jgi:hypothetical protein
MDQDSRRQAVLSLSSADMPFELSRDLSHLVDVDSDAFLLRFPGSENIAGWLLTRSYDLPERIYFEADLETLAWNDYPSNNVNWPLMSRRMLDVLLSVAPFPHRFIPVVMLDYRLKWDERFGPDGAPKPEAADYRFSAVQLTEHMDAFDWEHSEYIRDKYLPDRTAGISKLVLKEPPGGFPPLFRLAAAPSSLFISAPAKRDLEEAAVRGVQFSPLDTVLF